VRHEDKGDVHPLEKPGAKDLGIRGTTWPVPPEVPVRFCSSEKGCRWIKVAYGDLSVALVLSHHEPGTPLRYLSYTLFGSKTPSVAFLADQPELFGYPSSAPFKLHHHHPAACSSNPSSCALTKLVASRLLCSHGVWSCSYITVHMTDTGPGLVYRSLVALRHPITLSPTLLTIMV